MSASSCVQSVCNPQGVNLSGCCEGRSCGSCKPMATSAHGLKWGCECPGQAGRSSVLKTRPVSVKFVWRAATAFRSMQGIWTSTALAHKPFVSSSSMRCRRTATSVMT